MPKFHVSGRLFFNVRLPSSADASSINLAHVPFGSIWEHCNVVVTTMASDDCNGR